MAEEIKLLPLTYDESQALKITLSALIAAKVNEHCIDSMAKMLWSGVIPHITKINEKLNK